MKVLVNNKNKLENWFAEGGDDWVCWDGVTFSKHTYLSDLPDHVRSICMVSELGCVVGYNPHMTMAEFIGNNY